MFKDKYFLLNYVIIRLFAIFYRKPSSRFYRYYVWYKSLHIIKTDNGKISYIRVSHNATPYFKNNSIGDIYLFKYNIYSLKKKTTIIMPYKTRDERIE